MNEDKERISCSIEEEQALKAYYECMLHLLSLLVPVTETQVKDANIFTPLH